MAPHFHRWFLLLLMPILLLSSSIFLSANAQDVKPKAVKSKLSSSQAGDIARFKKAHALFLNFFKRKLFKEAETEVKTALKLARKLLGNKHLITATEMNNLAVLYTSTRRYKLAVPLFQEALAIRKALLKKDDGRILGTLEDLQTALFAVKKPV
ncbi:MAG: tetratricopeptide repeat protein, partial [bacterium]|nr:tetratricopeptide repeat protein [bacterium]